MRSSALGLGVVLVLVCAGLAGADYWLKERPYVIAMEQGATDAAGSSSSAMSGSGASSSKPTFVKKGTSTKKKSGADVNTVLASLQLIPTATTEASLLQLTSPGANVQTMVLLQNNDRAALFAWVENDDVKTMFASLKQALQEQFSPKLTGLIDVTQTPENGPPVDVLSFTDPAISAEKIVFIRVRTRLYEFHVTPKAQDVIDQLIAELSK